MASIGGDKRAGVEGTDGCGNKRVGRGVVSEEEGEATEFSEVGADG